MAPSTIPNSLLLVLLSVTKAATALLTNPEPVWGLGGMVGPHLSSRLLSSTQIPSWMPLLGLSFILGSLELT